MPGLFTYLLERRKRCKDAQGLKIGKWGGDPSSSVGTEGLPAPGRRRRGAGRGPEGGAGSTQPPPTPGRAPSRSLPLVPWWPPQSRRRSRAWGPGGAVAQRRRRQERPRRRWRLRGGSPPAAPRSSRRSLAPPARLSGAPAGSAWLRRPGSPMRSGGHRASATAATSAPAGVGGFAAAPGARPVPSGGGCRLRDDPPGHAEAAAAAARGECGAARSRARWPSAAQEGPGGKSSGRADGASCRGGRLPTPRLGRGVGGGSDLPPRVPREAGSAWGATRPRDAGKPSLRPGQRGGRVCEAGGWQGRWPPLDWPRAWESAASSGPGTYIPEGGRGRLFANSLGFSAPGAESRRVPGGGAGGQGERTGAESAGPRKPLELLECHSPT